METREKILTGIAALSLGAAAVLAGVEHWLLRGLKFDDAWIHLRYARNLAEGKGFVYNANERVLGSAGVLWDFLLAACARATSVDAIPIIVTVVNLLLLLACAAVVANALRRIVPGWFALIIAAILLSHGPLLVSSIGGMETTLLCLLYFLALLALAREESVLACLCAGTALCLRVESIGVMAAALLGTWLYNRKSFKNAAAALLVVPVPIFGWCWWYFGSPIANSTRAKSIVYSLSRGEAAIWCTESLLRVLPLEQAFSLKKIELETSELLGLFAFIMLSYFGYTRLRRKAPAASLVSLQAVAPFMLYSFANPLMFPWYACTFVPIATILALLGIFEISHCMASSRAALADLLALVLIVSFTISPLKSMWPSLSPPDSPNFSIQTPNARESSRTYQYANVARWLNERSTGNDRACISEIGAFGYFYHGRILDGLGLVSPEALRFHPVPFSMRPGGEYGVIAPGVVKTYRPEFVVSLDIFAGALFADPWFLENYVEVGRWPWFGGPAHWHDLPPKLWGASEIRVYRRR